MCPAVLRGLRNKDATTAATLAIPLTLRLRGLSWLGVTCHCAKL